MPDHVHLCLAIPPKFSVAFTIGVLKVKRTVRLLRQVEQDRARHGQMAVRIENGASELSWCASEKGSP